MATTTRIGGTDVPTARAARFSASIVSGLIASQLSGLLMAATVVLAFVFGQGTPMMRPLQVIASYLYGDAALVRPTAAVVLSGLLFHQGVCALWGLAYGLCAPLVRADVTRRAAILLGLAIGLCSQLIDINLITPPLMNRLYGHDLWAENVPALYSWLGHMVFGLGFAVFIPLFRHFWLTFAERSDLLTDDPRIS